MSPGGKLLSIEMLQFKYSTRGCVQPLSWFGLGVLHCEVHIVSAAAFELQVNFGLIGSKGHPGHKLCLKERFS